MRIGARTLQRIKQAVLGHERKTFRPFGESRRRGGGGGGVRPLEVQQVKLEWSGGFDGSSEMACTNRYNIYPRDASELTEDTRLASDVSVESRALAKGRCVKAPVGSMGEAYKLGDTWHLICAYGERYGTTRCDPV